MASKESFGDLLLCPICFIQFVGRVFQCLRGHTVCETCLRQLDACPVCREVFPGTRNFLLEDLIAKLTNASNSFDGRTPISIEANSTGTVAPLEVVAAEAPSNSSIVLNGREFRELDETAADEIFMQLFGSRPPEFPIPKQTSGLFQCRMINCDSNLPICRIYNHLRTFHKELYTEFSTPVDGPQEDVIFNYTVESSQPYRHAVHIPNFGLFFIIFNTIRSVDSLFVMAWVQCVSKNNYARQFRFCTELRMFNRDITYSDFVHGQQTDQQSIVAQKHCLYFRLKISTYAGSSLATNGDLTVKIGRHQGILNVRRSTVTNVRMLPAIRDSQPAVVSQSRGQQPPTQPPPPQQQPARQPQPNAAPVNGRPSRRQRRHFTRHLF